jgi:phosphopantetheine--protein transferase-like protein
LTLDPGGKPCHEQIGLNRRISFNLSHSASQLVVGLTEIERIGIDVEDLSQNLRVPLLVRHYFSPAERAAWLQLAPAFQNKAFFTSWTRKEAAWKLFGDESHVPWKNIEVSLNPAAETEVRITTVDGDRLIAPCFTWFPDDGSVASVVVTATQDGRPRYSLVLNPEN